MRYTLMVLLLVLFSLCRLQAHAYSSDLNYYEGPAQWDSFNKYMRERQKEDRVTGMSYMISGAIATLGGVAGYYNSDDSFSRGVYAIAQSVGVAAVGYGANRYWNGNEYNSFYYAVEGAPLTSAQKAELLRRFLEKEKEERNKTRWIKIATHSLIAAVNLYSASREEDKNVRGVLNFLAGTNAIIAFSYAF
ncbi:hypothetical protein [Bdellovibrio sp. HCB337]|uniref:hypothetical protein n=1 Tax=Bdellovibrio sp. HCB337 TaxID=3394358 RepID=UPI0039A6E0F8